LVLATVIHDLGKALRCFGELQWAVLGGKFPKRDPLSDMSVFPEFFAERIPPNCCEPMDRSLLGWPNW